MRDPYTVLGVSKSASQDEIKKAYRRLARTMHPDLHPGDTKAADRFKEINAAYGLLGDADKRARYDRGEVDADGNPRHPGFGGGAGGGSYRWRNTGAGGGGSRTGGPFGFDFDTAFGDDDLFSDIFARASRGRGGPGAGSRPPPRKGPDSHYRLTVSFAEAATGTTRRVRLSNGKTLDVKIPPRSEDGATLRLKGQGLSTPGVATPGDALVEITIKPGGPFRYEGADDVVASVPVTLKEAVLGAKVTVPTLTGRVAVTVPEGSNGGTTLRLRGKGAPRKDGSGHGDLLVRLQIVLPDPKDKALKDFLSRWNPEGADEDVRARLFED
ncbi:DnaJ-class molecular chaperone CbpA [Caenispirillum salinarum AK4]|uniref:DnaJ-class molecular chaperone CbpA n=1 Tax=Caenispirillum salinarum AK4 TaxID=1238182 RepID=K9HFS8_9PROT|nr:J domain-containing protein [Caenispirillum salinarum]EKV27501.1 DnaJ-class molecular chaperone CbpA [Caenispirillum salinarum AK4]